MSNISEMLYCQECTSNENTSENIIIEQNEKKPRKVTKCEHGKRKSRCVDCGGSEICEHKKIKGGCRECKGSSFCEHDRQRSRCKECRGNGLCIHDRCKSRCKECGGSSICEHNKIKAQCIKCNGSQICTHKKVKTRCVECNGSQTCEHKKIKSRCVECNGSYICEHSKRKDRCKTCGNSFCEHKKYRLNCIDCGGTNICEHKRIKYACKNCKGVAICDHNKHRPHCKQCNGSCFCKHGKQKRYCKICDGKYLCKSMWCETQVTKKYDGYCFFCYVHLFPNNQIVKNYKTKEQKVIDYLIKFYPNFTWMIDKKIENGCSKRRPDLLLDLGTHILIIEIDENEHVNYSCENKRIMELSQDVSHRPIVFIRFNPDGYTDGNGNKISSCWKINKTSGIIQINKKKEVEWTNRLDTLIETIQYWIDNPSEKTIEIVKLFYS
jgi:hypothetical protein